MLSMKITVLFFARARELAGTNSAQITLPEEADVDAALNLIGAEFPDLRKHLSSCRTAVNEEFVPLETHLSDDSVLAIIPPVSGG